MVAEYTPSPILSRVHKPEITPSRFSSPEIRSSPETLKRDRSRDRRNHRLIVNQVWIQTPGFYLELIWSSINPFYPKTES